MSSSRNQDPRDEEGLPPLLEEDGMEKGVEEECDVGASCGEAPAAGETEGGAAGNVSGGDPMEAEQPGELAEYVSELERGIRELAERNLELETKVGQLLVSYRKNEEETQRVRERLERERERRLALDRQKLFRRLLEPLDNLERSLTAARQSGESGALAMGVELVWRQMSEAFSGAGLERFDPTGDLFEPELHEAIGVVPAADEQDGRVLQVELVGYRLDGELLRPARVVVGRKE